jgi:hypothetical protein
VAYHRGQAAGECFRGFHEADLKFAPTYKYDAWSTYYDEKKEGGLKRVPAWCDRVLFRAREGIDVGVLSYTRHEMLGSDHRPVSALLQVDASGYSVPSPEEERTLMNQARAQESAPLTPGHSTGATWEPSVLVYDLPSTFLIRSEGGDEGCLIVRKETSAVSYSANTPPSGGEVEAKRVYGVMGIAKLSHATYLVCVTNMTHAGDLPQGGVFQVCDFLNPQFKTRNHQRINPKPQTLNPEPSIQGNKSSTYKPLTLNPKPSIQNPQSKTLNPEP